MRHAFVLALVLAACGDPPPLTIRYQLTTGPDQVCLDATMHPAATCSDVARPCDTYLSIRIVSPSDPTQAYVSVCQPVTGRDDLCSLAGVDLPSGMQLPEQTLEVQIALFAKDELVDVDGDGALDCPTTTKYAPGGLPVSALPLDGTPLPAVGGAAYYHPGDSQTVVSLGCTSQKDLAWCQSDSAIAVTATVKDFDNQLSVTEQEGNQLLLSVGEPHMDASSGEYVLDASDTADVARKVQGPVPSWATTLTTPFTQAACLEVLDVGPDITPALTCQSASSTTRMLDFNGVRLSHATLVQLLAAAKLAQVPAKGLVVGIVVDYTGTPLADIPVTATGGSVLYVSSDRSAIINNPGTSSSGIFLSEDAPFGTVFTAQGGSMLPSAPSAYGGLVDGKVTIVVLQFEKPQGT